MIYCNITIFLCFVHAVTIRLPDGKAENVFRFQKRKEFYYAVS